MSSRRCSTAESNSRSPDARADSTCPSARGEDRSGRLSKPDLAEDRFSEPSFVDSSRAATGRFIPNFVLAGGGAPARERRLVRHQEDKECWWALCGGERIGLVVLLDVADPTPMFDLRIAAAQGAGHDTEIVGCLCQPDLHHPGRHRGLHGDHPGTGRGRRSRGCVSRAGRAGAQRPRCGRAAGVRRSRRRGGATSGIEATGPKHRPNSGRRWPAPSPPVSSPRRPAVIVAESDRPNSGTATGLSGRRGGNDR